MLLPGVSPNPGPVAQRSGSAATLRRARLVAAAGDAFSIVLVAALDVITITHPAMRVPWLTRGQSLAALACLNALSLLTVWLRRSLPLWRAKHIVQTWTAEERRRFSQKGDSARDEAAPGMEE